MSRFKKTILFFFCFNLFCALDAHLFVMQGFAWAKMVYSYSQSASLPVALMKTFDGQHPCQVCVELARLKAQLPQVKSLASHGKIEILRSWPSAHRSIPAKEEVDFLSRAFGFHLSVSLSPPTPPPRPMSVISVSV